MVRCQLPKGGKCGNLTERYGPWVGWPIIRRTQTASLNVINKHALLLKPYKNRNRPGIGTGIGIGIGIGVGWTAP